MIRQVCKKLTKLFAKSFPVWQIRVILLRIVGYPIGSKTYIGEDILIIDEPSDVGMVAIGKRVAIAPRVTLVTSSYANFSRIRHLTPEKHAKIIVKDDAWIGTGVIVLPGVTIGECSVVAAGAVVTKDVPSFSIVAGIPARLVGRVKTVPSETTEVK